MTTMKIRGTIEPGGRLRLDVPTDLPAGAAEVLVVVQPEATEADDPKGGPPYPTRSGLLLGNPALAALDIDEALREMNDQWKASLADLP